MGIPSGLEKFNTMDQSGLDWTFSDNIIYGLVEFIPAQGVIRFRLFLGDIY
jgi:hypothetical protein